MVIALLWWGIAAIGAIFVIFCGIWEFFDNPDVDFNEVEHGEVKFFSIMYITSGFLMFYIVIFLCYLFVKRYISYTEANIEC